MGLFKSSQIKIDQIDYDIANLNNNSIIKSYKEKWGEFVETNLHLWIKERTELDMVFSLNFESISNSLMRMLTSKDINKLGDKYKVCNIICVYYSCLLGIGFAVTNKTTVTRIEMLPKELKNVFDLTYLPSYNLFKLVFVNHYKNNPHLAFQQEGHLLDTKNGIVSRAQSTLIEGSRAAQKLNYVIY